MKKTRRVQSLAAAALATAAPLLVVSCLSRTPGDADLASQVLIRRDRFGIPHILGETEEAAAFGFGYAQAEDHAVEIATRLVGGRGEEAKHFGAAGLENDFAMAQFDNLESSRRDLERASPLFRQVLRGFAAGINRYVEQHREHLPGWIPVFTEADVLANIRARAVSTLASASTRRALDAKYGNVQTASISGPGAESTGAGEAGEEEGPGSNALALGGSRTTTGYPILLCNPHLSWASLYWEAQVTVPGRIDFFGNTLAGYPVLWAGFNESLGWANTVNSVDMEDLYALTIDPKDPDRYIFEGQSYPLTSREAVVQVKEADGRLTDHARTFWYSHLGPVVHRIGNKAFAVKSERLDSHLHFEGFYRLARAKNLDEFMRIMREVPVFTTNFVYADAAGNVLYLWNARIPKRPDEGMDYRLDVPGDTARYVWNSLHPPEDLPRLLNPPGGYVQNCNNPPWYTSLRDPIDASRYPSYFDRSALALRPQLAIDLVESREKFSVEDVKRLKHSTRMLLAERVKPDLVSALRKLDAPSEAARSALAALEAWDDHVSVDSRGAVLFQRFWDTYSRAVPQPYAVPWSESDWAKTPRGLSDPVVAIKHVEEAVGWTRERFGSESVAWGEVHRYRMPGIDLPADGANGTYGCFRVLRPSEQPDGKRIAGVAAPGSPLVGFGDGWVMLVDFSPPVTAWSVLAYGQTTSPESPHSSDQLRIFARHDLRPVWFRQADIEANLERTYRPPGR